jgi:hypothetical protein
MFGSETNAKHLRRLTWRWLKCLGLAILTAGAAAAQPHPALSGYWELRYDSFKRTPGFCNTRDARGLGGAGPSRIEAVRWCDPIEMPAMMGDRALIDLRQSASVIGIVAKPQSSERYIYIEDGNIRRRTNWSRRRTVISPGSGNAKCSWE